jgi:CRP/FNR family transcriptional regulator
MTFLCLYANRYLQGYDDTPNNEIDRKLKEAIATFLNSVKSLCPKVTKAELDYLESGFNVTELKSKHFYIHANTIQKEIGFVYSGLLRAFYVDKDGNEISVNFIREGRYATHYSALITQTLCKYYFQCIEPSIIINLPYKHIQEGYNKFPILERYGRLVAEEVLKMQQRRIESFLFDNAETRYLDFIKENHDLFNRVSISYLSSYLGIERQTLTRIRKKLAHG